MKRILTGLVIFLLGLGVGVLIMYAHESRQQVRLVSQRAYSDAVNQSVGTIRQYQNIAATVDALPKATVPLPQQLNQVLGPVFAGIAQFQSQLQALVASSPGKPEWQVNIDWAFSNQDAGGSVDCGWNYLTAGYPNCILIGGRACLMGYAKDAAQRGQNQRAFDLTTITQCHNRHAWETIEGAGVNQVAAYVRFHPGP
jgi:hypothetical protein